jgi:hypothetical protein
MAAVVEAVKTDPTAEVLAVAAATEPADTAPGIPAIETAPRLPAVARGSQPPQRLELDPPVQEKSKIPRTKPGVTGRPRAPSKPLLSLDEEYPPTRVSQI